MPTNDINNVYLNVVDSVMHDKLNCILQLFSTMLLSTQ